MVQLLIPRPGGCYSQSNRFVSNCLLPGRGPRRRLAPHLAAAPLGVRGTWCRGVCGRQAVALAAGGASWATAWRCLFFGRAPSCQLLSHQLAGSEARGPRQGSMGSHGLLPGSSGAADFDPALLGFPAAREACQDRAQRCWAPGWLLSVPNAGDPDLGWSWAALRCPGHLSPAPTAWAGSEDLARADGDGTWEGMVCFQSC